MSPASWAVCLFTPFTLAALLLSAPALARDSAIAPKVLVITMFDKEAQPWLQQQQLPRQIALAGLSPRYPALHCSEDATLCLFTTDMGYANAATSTMALLLSERIDLRRSYVIIAGIGGIDPAYGTLGSAHWARYAVDGGLHHALDPRQIPADWESGILALGAQRPGEKPQWQSSTALYRLDETLLQHAYTISHKVDLLDSDAARSYRARYPQPPANAAPQVSICDTLSADTYWHGSLQAAAMTTQAAVLSDGKAKVCTTQMEDNATLTALKRGADAGRVDFSRIALLRTGSNFDREAPDQDVIQSLHADSGGLLPATGNAYRVGNALAQAILADWPRWRNGVPTP